MSQRPRAKANDCEGRCGALQVAEIQATELDQMTDLGPIDKAVATASLPTTMQEEIPNEPIDFLHDDGIERHGQHQVNRHGRQHIPCQCDTFSTG